MIDLFSKKHVVFDGAMGTLLLEAGLPAGASPDSWNITHPDAILSIHKAYLEAGAEVITTNTFGSNKPRQKRGSYSPAQLAEAGVSRDRPWKLPARIAWLRSISGLWASLLSRWET